MVFTAPAIHYSALATQPPELTLSKSQQSIKYTNNIKFKLNQIFKRLFYNHIHNEHIITTTNIQLPKIIDKENSDNTSIIIKNPNNNNSNKQNSIEENSSKSITNFIEPLERLPFTEPYFSISSKTEKIPFQLSTYHKHCIHQQKYINQKQYHHESSSSSSLTTKISQLNSSLSSSIKKHHSNLTNNRLKNLINEQNKIKSNSTTTLPISSSIENHIGLHYASRKQLTSNNHDIHLSNNQHLRRLQSKSKIRPISNETKTSLITSKKKSFPLSSSIAHRIELLKQSMHNNNQFEYEQISSNNFSSHTLINKETQTNNNNNQLKTSEIHYIHHHHIHSSTFLSIQWRTYLSIIGILLSIIFLIFIQLTTNYF